MAKERLFSEPTTTTESESDEPESRFDALASQVFSVTKEEIDKRESEWKHARKRKRVKKR